MGVLQWHAKLSLAGMEIDLNFMNLYSWTAITDVFSENKSNLTKKIQRRPDISIRVYKVSNVSAYGIHWGVFLTRIFQLIINEPLNLGGPPSCFWIQRWTVRLKRTYKPEEIVAKRSQVDVLHRHGSMNADAIREIGVNEVTFYRLRKNMVGWRPTIWSTLKNWRRRTSGCVALSPIWR